MLERRVKVAILFYLFLIPVLGFTKVSALDAITEFAPGTLIQSLHETESDCPTLDFRDRFGSEKNQVMHNYCWAMAGTSLLEEEYCLQNPSFCGKSLSTLDASSCNFRWGHTNETGIPSWAIRCVQRQGVCAESDAPFRAFQENNLFFGILRGKFKRSPFIESYFKLKARGNGDCVFCSTTETQDYYIHKFITEFRDHFPENDLSDDELKYYLLKSKDLAAFIDRVAISNRCVKNRIRPEHSFTTKTVIFDNKNSLIKSYFTHKEFKNYLITADMQTKSKMVARMLKKGRSVTVGVCLDDLLLDYKLFSKKPCQFGHAIVLNALRWNSEIKRCEVHVLNTFGSSSSLRNWKSLSEISNASFLLEQIETLRY
jgi:hypothetical protein